MDNTKSRGKGRGFVQFVLLTAIACLSGWVIAQSINLVVLNPQNPAYNPAERQAFDAAARQMELTNIIGGGRWDELLQSPSTECHYRAKPQPEFLLSGILPNDLIVPNTGRIKFYIQFPEKLDMFSLSQVKAGVVDQQTFYYQLVSQGGFKACDDGQAARARRLLFIP